MIATLNLDTMGISGAISAPFLEMNLEARRRRSPWGRSCPSSWSVQRARYI